MARENPDILRPNNGEAVFHSLVSHAERTGFSDPFRTSTLCDEPVDTKKGLSLSERIQGTGLYLVGRVRCVYIIAAFYSFFF